jgi:hypothetical protein
MTLDERQHVVIMAAAIRRRRFSDTPCSTPTVDLQSVVEEESIGNGALMMHLRGYRAHVVLVRSRRKRH